MYSIIILMEENMKNRDYKDTIQNLALISQVGLSAITPILLGVGLGRFMDKRLGKNGIFSIILIILGAIAGLYNMIRVTSNQFKNKK